MILSLSTSAERRQQKHKMDINSCTPYRQGTHKTFKSTENRCTHIGNNPGRHKVRHFQVDGGVFPKGTTPPRCDYLLVNDTAKSSYYIELKGSDIPKAIQQIDRSIEEISLSLPGYKIFRRIVYRTGTHKIDEKAVVKWKAKYAGTVRIAQKQMEENISE